MPHRTTYILYLVTLVLPAHGEEPGCVVRDVHAVDVELEGDRPHVGVEVEGGVGAAAEPTVQSS